MYERAIFPTRRQLYKFSGGPVDYKKTPKGVEVQIPSHMALDAMKFGAILPDLKKQSRRGNSSQVVDL